MKKITKNKKSGKAGSASGGKKIASKPKVHKKVAREKHYESHYLAICLIVFLLLEGWLISTTSSSDWQKGFTMLDVSSTVSQTISDTQSVFQPLTMAVDGVNQFYAIATDQMTQLLDLSGTDPLGDVSLVADGVNQFYQQAATQMAEVLDMSSFSSWPGNVAGTSVTVH